MKCLQNLFNSHSFVTQIFIFTFFKIFILDSRWIRIFYMEENEILPEDGRNEIPWCFHCSLQQHCFFLIKHPDTLYRILYTLKHIPILLFNIFFILTQKLKKKQLMFLYIQKPYVGVSKVERSPKATMNMMKTFYFM